MSNEYQVFRKTKLDEITRDVPSMKYRDKMAMVTREWKEYKNSQDLKPLSPEEMTIATVNQNFKSRLRRTDIVEIPEMICLIGRLSQMGETEFVVNAFKKILSRQSFHTLTFNGIDLWDILAINNGGYVILHILECFSTNKSLKEWIDNMQSGKRMGAVLNSVVSIIYDRPDTKSRVVNIISRLIFNGVSPNVEFQCGQYTSSLPSLTEDRNNNTIVGKPIRYAGTTLLEEEYADKYPVVLGSVRFVGDTLFGFLLQNMSSNKIYSFVLTLINTGLVSMTTVIQPYSLSLDTHMDYLTAAVKFAPSLYQNQVCCTIYKTIPKYVITRTKKVTYLRDVVSDILVTNWRGMVYFNTCPRNIIHMMLEDGLLEPSEDMIARRLVISPPALKSLQHSVVTGLLCGNLSGEVYRNIRKERVGDTILESLVYTPGSEPEDHHVAVSEMLRGYGYRNSTVYHNDKYFSSAEDVDLGSVGTFVSDDSYVFCKDEIAYLFKTKINPFNRREFSDAEMERLLNMITLFEKFWFMFDLSGRAYQWLHEPVCEKNDEYFAKLIDSFLEKSDMFMYGGRIMDIYDKLKKNALCLMGFSGLIVGIGTMLTLNSTDITIEQCSAFSRCKEDPYDIEDINIYYGLMINHIHEPGAIRRVFLQWLFLVLETTDKLSRPYLMTTRLLSLTLYIQMIRATGDI